MILEVLLSVYPDAIERDALDEPTGYKRSSRNTYLTRLNAKRLIDVSGSTVQASEALFS